MGCQRRRSSPVHSRPTQSSNENWPVPRSREATRKSVIWRKEDMALLKEMRSKGMNWQDVEKSGKFRDKTGNACRKAHERLLEQAKLERITNGISFEELSQAYMEVRQEMWTILIRKLGIEDWEVSEKLVFEWGLRTIKHLAKRPRRGLDESKNQGQPTAPRTANRSALQSPPLTDDAFSSRGTTPNQQMSPVPPSGHNAALTTAYYDQPQSLPGLPTPPHYFGSSRQPSQVLQSSHVQHTPPLPLPAMQLHSYDPIHSSRLMPHGPEYTMELRYSSLQPHAYARHALPVSAYHPTMTSSTRHEEFSGPKMSVQSILSEPSQPL